MGPETELDLNFHIKIARTQQFYKIPTELIEIF